MVGRAIMFETKTNDATWVTIANRQTDSIRVLTEVLLRCAQAVESDLIQGWRTEFELMSSLERFENDYKTLSSSFKKIGSPRSSNHLKQIKKSMDLFFVYCDFAFH
jgi:hypothetical protein